jgi:hypothetical protein
MAFFASVITFRSPFSGDNTRPRLGAPRFEFFPAGVQPGHLFPNGRQLVPARLQPDMVRGDLGVFPSAAPALPPSSRRPRSSPRSRPARAAPRSSAAPARRGAPPGGAPPRTSGQSGRACRAVSAPVGPPPLGVVGEGAGVPPGRPGRGSPSPPDRGGAGRASPARAPRGSRRGFLPGSPGSGMSRSLVGSSSTSRSAGRSIRRAIRTRACSPPDRWRTLPASCSPRNRKRLAQEAT